MIDVMQLTDALVTTLQGIPELVATLTNQDPANIIGYYDANPVPQTLRRQVYQMEDGTVLVAFEETEWEQKDTMSMWNHRFKFSLRAAEGGNAMTQLMALVNGKSNGSDQYWRLCSVLPPYAYPAQLLLMERSTDAEKIDFFEILIEIAETGDA